MAGIVDFLSARAPPDAERVTSRLRVRDVTEDEWGSGKGVFASVDLPECGQVVCWYPGAYVPYTAVSVSTHALQTAFDPPDQCESSMVIDGLPFASLREEDMNSYAWGAGSMINSCWKRKDLKNVEVHRYAHEETVRETGFAGAVVTTTRPIARGEQLLFPYAFAHHHVRL